MIGMFLCILASLGSCLDVCYSSVKASVYQTELKLWP